MSHWVARYHCPIEVDFDVLEESALAMAQSTIQNAIDAAHISKADLARKMRCNRSVVTRILAGNNLTVKTMARALAACGSEVRFEYVPLVWNWASAPQPTNETPAAPAASRMLAFNEFRTGRMSLFEIGEYVGTSNC